MVKTDLEMNIVLYVWSHYTAAWASVRVVWGNPRKTIENTDVAFKRPDCRVYGRRRASRVAGCRLAADVLTLWRQRTAQIELHCCVPMDTDRLAQPEHCTVLWRCHTSGCEGETVALHTTTEWPDWRNNYLTNGLTAYMQQSPWQARSP
jgi:hypothetical protein